MRCDGVVEDLLSKRHTTGLLHRYDVLKVGDDADTAILAPPKEWVKSAVKEMEITTPMAFFASGAEQQVATRAEVRGIDALRQTVCSSSRCVWNTRLKPVVPD